MNSRMQQDYQIVLCTCPDKLIAEKLANALVAKHLAACVNILPLMQSIYWWQDKITQSEELLLMIKTQQHNYLSIEKLITQIHPYETPEIM